ncbi:unnamed protein product [Acanthoscelides obtectus]|uniref:Uncharacterized protein n=1 Tax=Acanthoscelides obtectus TaxID=200917 RepID=A0A9P0MAM9_ACAOB|nr:unnamed protein product [Acanthoscelides obtectus]CAK1631017.1 hypothetical protein AOBTE_LOCUS6707 [Acanthoscelides obtectus]
MIRLFGNIVYVGALGSVEPPRAILLSCRLPSPPSDVTTSPRLLPCAVFSPVPKAPRPPRDRSTNTTLLDRVFCYIRTYGRIYPAILLD